MNGSEADAVMQLKTFQKVATDKAKLDQQVRELEAKLKATEVCWNHIIIDTVSMILCILIGRVEGRF
jgi:hypothetical protein